ncbi:MAG TPA: polysaccharide biosynthesis/export family protein [Syntrophorhabdaceae bacterium]|jgi:protein involved in polysaccharide export with SLBB domain
MRLGKLKGISVLAIIIGLAACAPNAVIDPAPFASLNQHALAYPLKEYVIVPGDVIDVKFAFHPEYNELNLPVRPDGRVSLQFAPDVNAAGLTPLQLRERIMRVIASELNKPEIAINVRTYAEQKVFVDGEVGGPRFIELKGATTVMTAITQAGGLRETARLSNVIVIRKDFDGKPAATMVDLRKVIDGSDFKQNIALMPMDIVYVPKSNIARVDKWVEEYITRVIPGLGSPLTYYWAGQSVNNH